MKNDFLDDDWLKEELSDEYIIDDDFSFSVVKKIKLNESQSKRNFYAILTTMIAIISFVFIPDLMTLSFESAEGAGLLSLFDAVNEQQTLPFMQMEFIGLCVICLSFILIWSFEDFDLI